MLEQGRRFPPPARATGAAPGDQARVPDIEKQTDRVRKSCPDPRIGGRKADAAPAVGERDLRVSRVHMPPPVITKDGFRPGVPARRLALASAAWR
jgi:hypothetical protein